MGVPELDIGDRRGRTALRILPASLLGFDIITDKRQAYPAVLAITLLMIAATVVIARSRLGRAFRAVRESEVAALAMGVPVRTTKLAAFALSAFFAGVAGAMFAIYLDLYPSRQPWLPDHHPGADQWWSSAVSAPLSARSGARSCSA